MGSGPILLSHLYCAGTEASLLDCNRYNTYNTLGCTHRDDAGVVCEGIFYVTIIIMYAIAILSNNSKNTVPCNDRDVRLVVSQYPGIGRIEVCANSSWGTICTNTWDDLDATVACRESGYSPYGWLSHFYIMSITIISNDKIMFCRFCCPAWRI